MRTVNCFNYLLLLIITIFNMYIITIFNMYITIFNMYIGLGANWMFDGSVDR